MNSSSTAKTILFWMFIVLLCVVLWRMVSASGQSARQEEPSYSEFMSQVNRGNVKEVTLYLSPNSYEIEGEWREPAKKFRVTIFKEGAPDLTKQLRRQRGADQRQGSHPRGLDQFPAYRRAALPAGGLLDRHDAADAGGRK